jgi:hypothetical protein
MGRKPFGWFRSRLYWTESTGERYSKKVKLAVRKKQRRAECRQEPGLSL